MSFGYQFSNSSGTSVKDAIITKNSNNTVVYREDGETQKNKLEMRNFQILAFLLIPYNLIGQNYIVESKDKSCIIFDIKNGINAIDTLRSCNSCTMVKDQLFAFKYYYPSFNPRPVFSLSVWRVLDNSIFRISEFEYKFKDKVQFDKINFILSNGFLVGTYRDENCVERINKKIILLELTQEKLKQFFLDFFSEVPH